MLRGILALCTACSRSSRRWVRSSLAWIRSIIARSADRSLLLLVVLDVGRVLRELAVVVALGPPPWRVECCDVEYMLAASFSE